MITKQRKNWLNQLKVGDKVIVVVVNHYGGNSIKVDSVRKIESIIKLKNTFFKFNSKTGKSVTVRDWKQEIIKGCETNKASLHPENSKINKAIFKLNQVLDLIENPRQDNFFEGYLETLIDNYFAGSRQLISVYSQRVYSLKRISNIIVMERQYNESLTCYRKEIVRIEKEIKRHIKDIKKKDDITSEWLEGYVSFHTKQIKRLNDDKAGYINSIKSIKQSQTIAYDAKEAEKVYKQLKKEVSNLFLKIIEPVLKLKKDD